jgi:hypothetical protein
MCVLFPAVVLVISVEDERFPRVLYLMLVLCFGYVPTWCKTGVVFQILDYGHLCVNHK